VSAAAVGAGLVDTGQVGSMDKLEAHRRPTRHLAFSVMLFADDGRVLLQRRADGKYHFAGRWSNTCCSHPRPGEGVRDAARRRTREELGLEVGDLEVRGAFWYVARDDVSGLAEHEYDVVVVGRVDGAVPDPDPDEVGATMLIAPDELRAAIAARPDDHTPWLARVLDIATGDGTPVAVDVPH
jgi:isopentenyl-diphosphate delta-isomerase